MQGALRCVTGSNPYFLVTYIDSLNASEAGREWRVWVLCLGAGCAAACRQDAGRHSAEAQLHGCPVPPLAQQQLCSLQGTPSTGTQGCPCCLQRAKNMLREHRVVLLPPLKKGCVRFNERNEWAPARLPARSPLLESQLDSVPLLNKYLLNLLLIMFRLIRAGVAVEILYELSTLC